MRSSPPEWMAGAAFVINLFLAVVILLACGASVYGIEMALRATARVAFFWFFAAYAGGALTTLFGSRFLLLKHRGRDFGLAFAAALLVHLVLVGWLCGIGASPSFAVFAFFGPAAILTLLFALLSFGKFRTSLDVRWWRLVRAIGMNFILLAFLKDFIRRPFEYGYLPFVAMAIVALLLRLAAWISHLRETRASPLSAERFRQRA
jgi:hypothetical protein